MNPLHYSQTAFYILGSLTLLAHLIGFVKNWLKIVEMRQKRKEKIAKAKTPHEKLRRRIQRIKKENRR